MSSVGYSLKACREKRQISQQELAWKIGLGTRTIEKYESGELLPDPVTILRISTVLDAPVSEFHAPKNFDAVSLVADLEHLVRKIGAINTKILLHRASVLAQENFSDNINKY